MSKITQVSTWFDATGGGQLVDAAFVFGGTHLLSEFFGRTTNWTKPKSLMVVSPFLDARLLERLPAFSEEHTAQTDFLLITTPAQARTSAAKRFSALKWHSCEIRGLTGIHAKLYVFESGLRDRIALIGSHNLTGPGAFGNEEAGVLIAEQGADSAGVIASIIAHVMKLRTRASLVYDSLAWPASVAAEVA